MRWGWWSAAGDELRSAAQHQSAESIWRRICSSCTNLIRCACGFFTRKGALPALADAAQILPGVDAGGVAVEPVELQGVAAYLVS